jgi:DNA-binding MarR family transcriptional regulator
MNEYEGRERSICSIDDVVRQITWQSHKQLLQTLSRPEIALTMPQMVTLFAIRAAGTCRMSELAEITQQSAGTLTGIVDRLIEDNLVGRVRDMDDRRVVQVTLTPHGDERLARVEQARREEMERMLQRFTQQQLIELEQLLRLLVGGIHELLNGEPVALVHHSPTPSAYPPLHRA